MIKYNKLIRDKIPEIIGSTGKEYQIIQLDQAEYKHALKLKLIEEAKEVLTSDQDNLAEEIADIYEVIDSLIKVYNLDQEKIKKIQKIKIEERGKFEQKLKLIGVQEKLIDIDNLAAPEQNLLAQIYLYLETQVSPQANSIDNDASALSKIVQEIKETQPDIFHLKLSRQWGGVEISKLGFYLWQTMIAKYSGALAFLQTQHQSAVSMLCQSQNKIAQDKYLPAILNNLQLYGVGFSHLRRQGKPSLKAIPVNGGYYLTGYIPWITGYGFFSHFIVGATLPSGEEFYGITRLTNERQKQGSIELSEPLQLSAFNSTNTVTAELNQWFISQDDVIRIKPPSSIHRRDKQNILHHGFFALGCCQASLEICRQNSTKLNLTGVSDGISRLSAEFASLWQKMFTAITDDNSCEDDRLNLRVQIINLLYRCVSGAVITSKGSANSLTNPANRLYREALVYGVSGQTIPLLDSYFQN